MAFNIFDNDDDKDNAFNTLNPDFDSPYQSDFTQPVQVEEEWRNDRRAAQNLADENLDEPTAEAQIWWRATGAGWE